MFFSVFFFLTRIELKRFSMISSSDKSVKIWDTKAKRCVYTSAEHSDQVWCVRFNYSGTQFVSMSQDKSIIVHSFNR